MRSRAFFTIGWIDLDGSLRMGESTLLNKDGSVYLCLLSDGIAAGRRLFYPLYYKSVVRQEQRRYWGNKALCKPDITNFGISWISFSWNRFDPFILQSIRWIIQCALFVQGCQNSRCTRRGLAAMSN
jgi:hypothetical protein